MFNHVFPKSLGGTLATDNVIGLCKACNQEKAAKLVDIYRFYKYANKASKEAAKLVLGLKICYHYKFSTS